MVTGIIIAAAVVGILGILIGVFLGIASEKFKVEVDEKEILVRNELPGNNCGGCGYAGCDALAKAIAAGQADVGACPVGGASTAEKIGAIMGVAGGAAEKKVAFVKCKGSCDKTAVQYNYYGVDDCKKVSVVPGAGEKACAYGCMGYGSCVRACAFDAIHVVDGVALVDREKCTGCGACAKACPNAIISIIPEHKRKPVVLCQNKDKGAQTRKACSAGCIGCMKCAKACPKQAITVENNLAYIDQEKCVGCGLCAKECPVGVIHVPAAYAQQVMSPAQEEAPAANA